MIIAIITQEGVLSNGIDGAIIVSLFKIEDGEVVEVESITLEETSDNHFSLLMVMKKVNLIYIGTISQELRKTLNNIRVKIKSKDELSDDELMHQFIFN